MVTNNQKRCPVCDTFASDDRSTLAESSEPGPDDGFAIDGRRLYNFGAVLASKYARTKNSKIAFSEALAECNLIEPEVEIVSKLAETGRLKLLVDERIKEQPATVLSGN